MVGNHLIILIAVVSVIFIGLILFKKKTKKKHKEEQVAAGLQILNSNGRVVFDSSKTDKYARILGRRTIAVAGSGSGFASGSYLAPGMSALVQSGHTPFFTITPSVYYWNEYENMRLNLWMTNDGTLHWKIAQYSVSKSVYAIIGVI